ncbi:MAG TPA: response regulator transcription factor [Puia sp.]|nr:response regulator transcription factor [Puia sp.]
MNNERCKIALADDHSLIRKGLVELINTFDSYQVDFHVGNGQEFIARVGEGSVPDIAMLDVNMPKKDGYETAAWLKSNYPDVRVLALSMYDEERAIIRMLKCGAKGYIFKDAEPAELKEALDSIMKRGYHYSELITGHLIHNIHREDEKGAGRTSTDFNEREMEFFRYICTEMSYKEIGEKMFLSARTVEGYRDALCERLHLRSRVGLALYALKNGIINLGQIDLREEK